MKNYWGKTYLSGHINNLNPKIIFVFSPMPGSLGMLLETVRPSNRVIQFLLSLPLHHSSINSFIHSSIHSFILYPCTILLFINLFNHPFIHSVPLHHTSINSFIHSSIHSFCTPTPYFYYIHSFIH